MSDFTPEHEGLDQPPVEKQTGEQVVTKAIDQALGPDGKLRTSAANKTTTTRILGALDKAGLPNPTQVLVKK